jgi:hypothetical protein
MKQCSKCGLEKEESEFNRENICNSCRREYHRKYDKKYRKSVKRVDYLKRYYRFGEYHKSVERIEYLKEYYKSDKYIIYQRKYQRKYQKSRYCSDIQYKLSKVLRVRLSHALKGNFKVCSAVKDLGCTIVELKVYLEERFQPGMTWENYGEWELDHKYPLSKVDLIDREQLLRVCHYTNLQPLWKLDNIRKGDKVLDF